MRYFVFKPSERLCDIEIGQEFQLKSDGKWYILLKRDILSCVIARETWWDKVKRFLRGEKHVGRKGNGNSTTN